MEPAGRWWLCAAHQWAHGGLVGPALGVTILYPFTKRFFHAPGGAGRGVPAWAASRWPLPLCRDRCPGWRCGWCWATQLWVLAYDTEYAMVDRDDDLKLGGMKTSAITLEALGCCGHRGVLPGFCAFWTIWRFPAGAGCSCF